MSLRAKRSTALLVLAALAGPLPAQTPQIHGTPLPSGRIGIQFPAPSHATLTPGRPVELHFEVAPLPSAPAAPPKSSSGAECATSAESLDQSGDSKMVVRGMSPGAPPVAMPGAGPVCPPTSPAPKPQ